MFHSPAEPSLGDRARLSQKEKRKKERKFQLQITEILIFGLNHEKYIYYLSKDKKVRAGFRVE